MASAENLLIDMVLVLNVGVFDITGCDGFILAEAGVLSGAL
jgi:hypothetical protein